MAWYGVCRHERRPEHGDSAPATQPGLLSVADRRIGEARSLSYTPCVIAADLPITNTADVKWPYFSLCAAGEGRGHPHSGARPVTRSQGIEKAGRWHVESSFRVLSTVAGGSWTRSPRRSGRATWTRPGSRPAGDGPGESPRADSSFGAGSRLGCSSGRER